MTTAYSVPMYHFTCDSCGTTLDDEIPQTSAYISPTPDYVPNGWGRLHLVETPTEEQAKRKTPLNPKATMWHFCPECSPKMRTAIQKTIEYKPQVGDSPKEVLKTAKSKTRK